MEGRSLREFITMAVVHELERARQAKTGGRRVKLPLVPSNRPGSLRVTEETIHEALAQEDVHALA